MVPQVWLLRFLIKGSEARSAIYVVNDQELLRPSNKSQTVLQKPEEVGPQPTVYPLCVRADQSEDTPTPSPPQFNFHIHKSWSSGIIMVMLALSVARSKESWKHLKEQTK